MQDCGFRTEIDTVAAPAWSALLETFADASIYQTWSYGAVCWGASHLSHLVLKKGEGVVAAAQLRIVRPSILKCGLAYVRWGPLCHRTTQELDPDVVGEVARALYAEYVRRRGLFLRVFPNALQGTARASALQAAFSTYSVEPFGAGQTYRTLVLDLAPPLEELRRNLDQKWRNQLNRAEKNGLEVTEADSEEDFEVFLRMYGEMVTRKKFETSTNVPQFAQIQRSLAGGEKMRVFLCRHGGVPVAGLVGTAMGDTGIYLHGATSDEGLNLKGAYLLQWRMISWLKEHGVRYYNLGGINPETNPGVYHFKKGLKGEDCLYLSPFTACENPLSALFAGVAGFARGGLCGWIGRGAAMLRAPEPARDQKSVVRPG